MIFICEVLIIILTLTCSNNLGLFLHLQSFLGKILVMITMVVLALAPCKMPKQIGMFQLNAAMHCGLLVSTQNGHTTLSIMTLSQRLICDTQHCNALPLFYLRLPECHYAECRGAPPPPKKEPVTITDVSSVTHRNVIMA
jgi:hypothetical protein